MRGLLVATVVAATAAGAAELELTLPPSADWEAKADPNPLPNTTATSRYFVKTSDPELSLRVVTDSTLRLDYSQVVVEALAKRLASDPQLEVGAIKTLSIGGVLVGSVQVVDAARTSTLFYLPSEGGDRVLGLTAPTGRAVDLKEIVTIVEGARHLRPPDTFASGPVIMGSIAGVTLTALSVLLFVMRKRPSAAA